MRALHYYKRRKEFGTVSPWQDIVNGVNIHLNRQAVENEKPSNRVEPGKMLNDPYNTFSHRGEVEDLHGFQYGEVTKLNKV